MKTSHVQPTGVERYFGEEEIIVSKTDLKGKITYANEVFIRIAGYSEEELLGQPHNLIRHPDMPRCVFKLLWETIEKGKEIFAYVKNMAKNGDHYWVFAHVTPTFGKSGEITGYHSNRRTPDRSAVEKVEGIYKALLAEENKYASPREGMEAATRLLVKTLEQSKMSYEGFVFAV